MKVLDLPLFFGAINPRFTRDGDYIFNSDSRFVGREHAENGRKSFALFTTADRIDEYGMHEGIAIHAIEIESVEAIIEIAERAAKLHGCTDVVVDPGFGPDGFVPECDRVPGMPADVQDIASFVSGIR